MGRGTALAALDEAAGICRDAGREGLTVRLAGGWWWTVTLNLDRIIEWARGDGAGLVPRGGEHDAAGQLARAAGAVRKGLCWRARGMVGERVRWYKVPGEVPRL